MTSPKSTSAAPSLLSRLAPEVLPAANPSDGVTSQSTGGNEGSRRLRGSRGKHQHGGDHKEVPPHLQKPSTAQSQSQLATSTSTQWRSGGRSPPSLHRPLASHPHHTESTLSIKGLAASSSASSVSSSAASIPASHLKPLDHVPTTPAPPGRDTSSSRWATTPPKPAAAPPLVPLSGSKQSRPAPTTTASGGGGALDQIEAMLAKLRTSPKVDTSTSSTKLPQTAALKPATPAVRASEIAKKPVLGGRSRWDYEGLEEDAKKVMEKPVEVKNAQDVPVEVKKEAEVEAAKSIPLVEERKVEVLKPAVEYSAPPIDEEKPAPSPSTILKPPPPLPPSEPKHIDWADEDEEDDLPPLDDWLPVPDATPAPLPEPVAISSPIATTNVVAPANKSPPSKSAPSRNNRHHRGNGTFKASSPPSVNSALPPPSAPAPTLPTPRKVLAPPAPGVFARLSGIQATPAAGGGGGGAKTNRGRGKRGGGGRMNGGNNKEKEAGDASAGHS